MNIWKILLCMTARIFSSRVPSAREDKIRVPKQSYNVLFITDIDETFKPKAPQFCIYFKSTVNSGHLN